MRSGWGKRRIGHGQAVTVPKIKPDDWLRNRRTKIKAVVLRLPKHLYHATRSIILAQQ